MRTGLGRMAGFATDPDNTLFRPPPPRLLPCDFAPRHVRVSASGSTILITVSDRLVRRWCALAWR
jgi:hypothetical protein